MIFTNVVGQTIVTILNDDVPYNFGQGDLFIQIQFNWIPFLYPVLDHTGRSTTIVCSQYNMVSQFFNWLKNTWEGLMPIECFVPCYEGIINQRIATFDIIIKRGKLSAFLSSSKPKGQLGNFHRFFIDVHPIEIVLQNRIFDIGKWNMVTQ